MLSWSVIQLKNECFYFQSTKIYCYITVCLFIYFCLTFRSSDELTVNEQNQVVLPDAENRVVRQKDDKASYSELGIAGLELRNNE